MIKLNCYYCGKDLYRKLRIVAPMCASCINSQETKRFAEKRRQLRANDHDGKYAETCRKRRRKYWSDHDYADRSRTARPRRLWTEGEKQAIFESQLSNVELAEKYKVSASAISILRWKMSKRQSVLLREENQKEIERRGGLDP